MIKKVKTSRLRVGVYVHDFNAPWHKHSFLTNSVYIKNNQILQKLKRSALNEVLIDTTKGIDIQDYPSKDDIKQYFKAESLHVLEHIPTFTKPTSLKDELNTAKKVKAEVETLANEISSNIQTGQEIETGELSIAMGKVCESISRNKNAMIMLMNIKEKSEYIFMHSVRVSIISIAFAKYLKMDSMTIKNIAFGALLHDFGKYKIPLEILNKPGRLTLEEFHLTEMHPIFGQELLADIPNLAEEVKKIVKEHHEQYDGFGYPNKLKGDQISLASQVVSIANVYDRLTSDTENYQAYEPIKALKMIFDLIGYFFENRLAQKFIKAMGLYPPSSLVRLKSDTLAIVLEPNENLPFQPKVRAVYDIKRGLSIIPRDIDLAKETMNPDQIVSSESPAKWRIDISNYLGVSSF